MAEKGSSSKPQSGDQSKAKKSKGAPKAEASGKVAPAAPKVNKRAQKKAEKKARKQVESEAKRKAIEDAKPPKPVLEPRDKVFSKLKGRLMPSGPLRERHKEILLRWNSGPDHGGVTAEELKALLADRKAAKPKTTRSVTA